MLLKTSSICNFFIAPLSLLLLLSSCEKTSVSDSDIVGNWKRRSEFEGIGRTDAVSFTIGNKVFIGGGFDGQDRLHDFWYLDDNINSWIRIADFPGTGRNAAVAFSANGKGYVGTGYDEYGNNLKDFWEYDPAADSWTQKADFAGTPRYGAVAFAINDKGYITTGYDGNYLKDLWEYNPGLDSWTQKASYGGSKRRDASVFIYNNQAYLVGGVNNGSYLNDFWVYDPVNNEWTEKRKISDISSDSYDDDYDDYIRRSNAAVFLIGNKAYLCGGYRNGIISTTWEYDIATDLWLEKTSFEGSAREAAIAFSVNNKGYIITGGNSSYTYDDMWEFFPAEEQNDDDN